MRRETGTPKILVLKFDYSRAPCLGADQRTRGLWERDWYLWRIPEMDAPRALVFRPLVKGNEALGTRLCMWEKEKLRHSKVKYKFVFHKVSSPPSPSSLLKLPNKPIW